jgi:hypothetical protein|tara:strand:+ start:3215 stop:3610 length:396 start_codon:yes stop_codon:yes gene_type:complete
MIIKNMKYWMSKHSMSPLKDNGPIDISKNTPEENRLLMQGFKRQAADRAKQTKQKQEKEKQYQEDLKFVKDSTTTVLKGEDPVSQAFSYAAGGGILNSLKALAKTKGAVNIVKNIKRGKNIKTGSGFAGDS